MAATDDRTEADIGDRPARRIGRRRRRAPARILRSTPVLPSLATILNALAGLGAIHFATKDALGEAASLNLTVAVWLIFAAMVFDMLDGRLARFTRQTSDFGGQLDSLADVVSFGVAPAMLMLRTVVTALRGGLAATNAPPQWLTGIGIERVVWCVAAIYLACTTLRLARFNVENEPDDSSHMDFRGLPSPAAAAVVAALVLLFEHLAGIAGGWRSAPWLLVSVGVAMPVATLGTALLMVSRLHYPHVVNQYVRGRRPFSYLVKLVVVLIAAMVEFYVAIAAVALIYALSGPVAAPWRHWRQPGASGEPAE